MLGCLAAGPPRARREHGQKLALFPEPAEEILGAAAGGKMYVFAGLAPVWKPMGMVYEYDPATDKWTKKKPMALPSHHVAFTEYHGKIYAFGGFVYPQSGPPAWVPINNTWEYDPANGHLEGSCADADQARLGRRGGGGRQNLRDRRSWQYPRHTLKYR